MLNFGIIGCGAIGRRHALHASATGRLKAVCDTDEGRAIQLAKEYGANAYASPEALLSQEQDLDVIAVCTPNGWHARHSILGLRAGLHVICEKPMALHSHDCRQMILESRQAGRHLFVVKQNRFNPPVIKVKKMLEMGQLGVIHSVLVNGCWNRGPAYYSDSWHGTREMDGGILFTQFSHFIDLLYWMIGEVKEACAIGDNLAHKDCIEFDDTIAACLRFENGVIGSLHFTINSFEKNTEGAILLVAEKGTVKIGGQYLNTLEYMDAEHPGFAKPGPGNAANDYGAYKGSMSNHDKMYQHVSEVLTKGMANRFDGAEAMETVEIIEKIYQAIRPGLAMKKDASA